MDEETGETKVNMDTMKTTPHFLEKGQFLGFSGSSGPVHVTRFGLFSVGSLSSGCPCSRSRSRRDSIPSLTSETIRDIALDEAFSGMSSRSRYEKLLAVSELLLLILLVFDRDFSSFSSSSIREAGSGFAVEP